MTKADEIALDALCSIHGLNRSQLVRALIDREAILQSLPGRDDSFFIYAMVKELKRARAKHPTTNIAAMTEECGEVAQALLDKTWGEVRKESIQLAAVSLRLAIEGDPTMAPFRTARGLNNPTSVPSVAKLP